MLCFFSMSKLAASFSPPRNNLGRISIKSALTFFLLSGVDGTFDSTSLCCVGCSFFS